MFFHHLINDLSIEVLYVTLSALKLGTWPLQHGVVICLRLFKLISDYTIVKLCLTCHIQHRILNFSKNSNVRIFRSLSSVFSIALDKPM